jgi:hypothetical protein
LQRPQRDSSRSPVRERRSNIGALLLLDERGTYVGVGLAGRGDMRETSWERAEQAAGRW